MSKYYINKNSNSFGVYTNFIPSSLSSDWVEISETLYNEVQDKINDGYEFTYADGKFTYTKTEVTKTQDEIDDELRAKREPLLKAFDIYRSAVAYGLKTETVERNKVIVEWYNNILDLDEDAINNVPEEIQYYL